MRPASQTPRAAAVRCLHCGNDCANDAIVSADGTFCCHGCASVYALLQRYQLDGFYRCDVTPGVSQKTAVPRDRARFAALDDPIIASRLIDFADERIARVTFSIPGIHCASCVWLLEQLWRLDDGIASAEVDLLRRSVRVDFDPSAVSLRRVAELLAAVGYEPAITAEEEQGSTPALRRLYLQLGVAGFAFGNIMLFSIPRYANGAPLDGGFQRLFDALNIALAIPVLLFSASDYFRTAWQSLRTRTIALEVPVALGLIVLFARSVVDIATSRGEGFMDSFAGLVFFLLIGRLFQQKVFARIAFDRTFRSFLPLSVHVERPQGMTVEPIERLQPGDRIIVRTHEVVPADAELLDEAAAVDYAFTTGEQTPIAAKRGDLVRAGGRAAAGAMRLRVVREVSQTRLAALWNNPVFGKPKERWITDVTARFGAWFTVTAVGLAAAGAVAWWPDARASAAVATAVLIIACPCALTLSAPITLGTAMGQMGLRGLYLKHPAVALDMSRIDTVVFDKTGTLTAADSRTVAEVHGLSDTAWARVRRLAGESVHPTSRAIATAATTYTGLRAVPSRPEHVREIVGQGLCGTVDGQTIAIGSATFIAAETGVLPHGPAGCTFAAAGSERGWVRLTARARPGIEQAARDLSAQHDLFLLSGDHDLERSRWATLFGGSAQYRSSPEDKLAYVENARRAGRHVLMVGDGLNDAGALRAADVGMAVSDETACITPACDAVIGGDRLAALPAFLRYARRARQVVVICFAVSLVYNAVGLTLALAGALTPLAAAILMPVSSLTIVGLSSGAMRWFAKELP
ncbi:MAG TPA: heavy metal translocating P-type ATPase metal-binding domain-containing protein [Vicinamibacterales bacterium]|nr:heavy metal translocating P-type ATPase metal-binding domain-containing protein [Vicinamibacterales bacterium]